MNDRLLSRNLTLTEIERGGGITMKRHLYKGHWIIYTDDLGRKYVYNTHSPYTEESDYIIVGKDCKLKDIKEYCDYRDVMERRFLEDVIRAYKEMEHLDIWATDRLKDKTTKTKGEKK